MAAVAAVDAAVAAVAVAVVELVESEGTLVGCLQGTGRSAVVASPTHLAVLPHITLSQQK